MVKDGEATMSPLVALQSDLGSSDRRPIARVKDLQTCAVCADTMIAAEASAFLTDGVVSYLWTCETCGYGFVTKHAFKQIVCN